MIASNSTSGTWSQEQHNTPDYSRNVITSFVLSFGPAPKQAEACATIQALENAQAALEAANDSEDIMKLVEALEQAL